MGFAELVTGIDRVALSVLGGETVVYRPQLGAPLFKEITAIFDANYVLTTDLEHAGVEAHAPALFARREDLPEDPDWDEPVITVRGVDYQVVERKPDSLGGVLLVLRLVD